MPNRIQPRLEGLMALRCRARLQVAETGVIPREARSVMEDGYLETENLRRALANLREEQRTAQALLARRGKHLEDWETRRLPEPPEIPVKLLVDSRRDLEETLQKIQSAESSAMDFFRRYRFPEGRPLPAEALGCYRDGQVTLYSTVLIKAADDFALGIDRLRQLVLVYFLSAGVAHTGLDADSRSWDIWSQAEAALIDALATYYTYCYAEKYDTALLNVLQLWLEHRCEGNQQWTELRSYSKEAVRTALIIIRQEPAATWPRYLELISSLGALGQ